MSIELTDEILQDAAIYVRQAMLDSLPVDNTYCHDFSPKFEEKIERLLKQTKRRYYIGRIAQQAAAIVLAALVGISTWLAVDTEARAATLRWIREIYENSIDSVCISPDGEYIVYRTNRDASNLNDTSIWKIDLGDNSEERLVSPSLNNDIVGFLTDGTLVAGAHDDSRLIDIVDGSETNISLPSLSNRCIKGVKAGKIVFTCYQDDSSISTAHICSVDLDSGNLTDICPLITGRQVKTLTFILR